LLWLKADHRTSKKIAEYHILSKLTSSSCCRQKNLSATSQFQSAAGRSPRPLWFRTTVEVELNKANYIESIAEVLIQTANEDTDPYHPDDPVEFPSSHWANEQLERGLVCRTGFKNGRFKTTTLGKESRWTVDSTHQDVAVRFEQAIQGVRFVRSTEGHGSRTGQLHEVFHCSKNAYWNRVGRRVSRRSSRNQLISRTHRQRRARDSAQSGQADTRIYQRAAQHNGRTFTVVRPWRYDAASSGEGRCALNFNTLDHFLGAETSRRRHFAANNENITLRDAASLVHLRHLNSCVTPVMTPSMPVPFFTGTTCQCLCFMKAIVSAPSRVCFFPLPPHIYCRVLLVTASVRKSTA